MYDKGLEIRTAVMGKAYVDKALAANAEAFFKSFFIHCSSFADRNVLGSASGLYINDGSVMSTWQ